jgi:hypothetical protein
MNIKLDINQIAILLIGAVLLFAAGWLWNAEKRFGRLEQSQATTEQVQVLERRTFILECKARIAPECQPDVMEPAPEGP